MFQFVQVAVHTLNGMQPLLGLYSLSCCVQVKILPRIFVLGSRGDAVSALPACGCTWETFSHLFVFHLSWSAASSHACRRAETQDNKQHVHVTVSVDRTLPSGSVRTSLYGVCRNSDLIEAWGCFFLFHFTAGEAAAPINRIFCLPAVSCCSHSCCVAPVFGNTFHFFSFMLSFSSLANPQCSNVLSSGV